MSKYLFATDGSDESEEALKFLEDQLDAEDTVEIIHILPDPQAMDWRTDQDALDLNPKLREAANNIVEEVAERLRDTGADVNTMILEGEPSEEIITEAQNRSVDSIVMGRRGQGTASELLLGSVSHYVIHHAPCPVTVVSN